MIIIIVILVLFLTLRIYLWYRNTAKKKGQRGEARVANMLAELPKHYVTLNDVVFAYEKGTTQIDHIVVSPYAIFTIETKNYRGEIYGNDDKNEWKQIIKTRKWYRNKWYKIYTYITKNTLYNPVRQSIGHKIAIKKLIEHNYELPIIPIVVFVGDADLTGVHSRYHVLTKHQLLPVIKEYTSPYLSDNDITDIVNILQHNNVHDKVSNRQHVKNIEAVQEKKLIALKSGICPQCGGNLIKRNGHYGTFYGCSNYPTCKYTVDK